MRNYLDKAGLYAVIEEHRTRWDISLSDYPINILSLCQYIGNIIVKQLPFHTPGLRGMATKRCDWNSSDIILLNASRSKEEQNFDCGHELIHLTEHRKSTTQTFHCFDQTIPSQDCFLEWQANEGSAELILPYRILITQLVDEIRLARGMGIKVENNMQFVPEAYAKRYNVTEAFIRNRIDSLSYEICQYDSGVSIDEIEILSRKKQNKKGIDLRRYDIFSLIEKMN